MSVLTFKQVTKTFQDGHHEINALKATVLLQSFK